MANILSLAVRVTGDASGLQLNPVEKALQRLQNESDKTSKIFEKFAQTSELGAKAQETFDAASAALLQTLRDGNITRDEFVKQFAELEAGARETAAALAEGARVTEANRTAEERYAVELQRLNGLREKGGIDQETYNRAVASARKPLDDAAAAAERAAQASGNSALKFNELSGVFAVLPGPLGNIAGRISGLSSAGEGLSRIFAGGLQSGIKGLVGSFTALVNPVTATLAGLTAVATIGPRLASSLDALESRVERLGNQAAQLGVSFDFIQVVEETARRSGVSVGSLEGAFTRLQRTIAEAADGTKTATDALGRLGLTFEDIQGLDEQAQFELIGERISAIEDPALRTAAAVEIFGRSGAQLLPFFNNLGPAGDDIERLGRSLTDLDKEQIDSFGRSVDALATASQGLGQTLLLPFVGLGEGVSNALADVISGVTAIVDPLGRALRPLLAGLGQALQTIGAIVNVAGRIIGAIISPIAALADKFFPATAAANDTAKAIEKVRDEVAKPADTKVFRDIENAATRTNRLLADSARDIGVAGQAAGVAYIRLIQSIRAARLSFDRTTPEGAAQFLRAVEQANSAYEKQVRIIKEANDARLAQIQSEQNIVDKLLEQQRIEQQFDGDSRRAQSAEAAAALTAEIQRLESRLSDIRNTGTQEEDNLQAQIANLEQLRRTEVDIASGRAQRREAEYERERERVQAIADERERVEKEAAQRIAQQRQTINEFVNEQLALQQFDGDAQKLAAYRNVLAIEEEIKRVETEGANARARGDTQGLNAAIARIGQLDQIAAKENDIASGRAAAEEELAKARDESLKEQQKQVEAYAKAQEQQASQAQAAQQKQNEEFQKFFEASAAENERVLEKNRQLATASTEAAQGADIRTTEGANAFIAAVQGGFDPQLALQRQQLKVLQRIDGGLALNLARLGFQTVAFPGRAGG